MAPTPSWRSNDEEDDGGDEGDADGDVDDGHARYGARWWSSVDIWDEDEKVVQTANMKHETGWQCDDDDELNNEPDEKDDKHCHLVDGGGGDGHGHLLLVLVAPFIGAFNLHGASILELVTIFSQN